MVAQSTKAVSQLGELLRYRRQARGKGRLNLSRNTGISSTKKEISTHV